MSTSLKSAPVPTPATGAPSGYRDRVRRLESAQKPGYGVPAYTRYVNRWLGRRLAAALDVTGVSPDGVTMLSLVASLLGLGLLVAVPAEPWSGPCIALLMALGYALDSADGQLARLRRASSKAGEWLDHVVDAFRMVLLHVSVAAAVLLHPGHFPTWFVIVPLLFGVVSATRFFSLMLAEQLSTAGQARGAEGTGRLRTLVLVPLDFGVLCLVLGLAPVPVLFPVTYTALAVVVAAWTTRTLVARYAALRRADADASAEVAT